MKYKVGDKVRVREDLISNKKYVDYTFVYDMNQYKGKEFVIEYVEATSYKLRDINGWWFTAEMFESSTETINDIIVEIKQKWSEINILLNRLESNLHD